jgi:hypothetical protein
MQFRQTNRHHLALAFLEMVVHRRRILVTIELSPKDCVRGPKRGPRLGKVPVRELVLQSRELDSPLVEHVHQPGAKRLLLSVHDPFSFQNLR